MTASEAMYGNTVSYVSSSAYYGFVPLKHRECDSGELRWNGVERLAEQRNCHDAETDHGYQGAMETDDDIRDAVLVNNSCVIPEAWRGPRSNGNGNNRAACPNDGCSVPVAGFAARSALERYAQTHHREALARRWSRKRNNAGDFVFVDAEQAKRLRKGSGNSCAYLGRGHSEDSGLASLRYKPSRLRVSFGNESDAASATPTNNTSWSIAGSHSFVTNNTGKSVDSSAGRHSNENDVDYEKMLLETHGCSAYNHQRLMSQSNHVQVQFHNK